MTVAQAQKQAWCGVVPKKVPLQLWVTRVLQSTSEYGLSRKPHELGETQG